MSEKATETEIEQAINELLKKEATRLGIFLGKALDINADEILFKKQDNKLWRITCYNKGTVLTSELTPAGDLDE